MAKWAEHTQYCPTTVSAPGETLRELLEERGISQSELSDRTGRSRKTINEILQAKTAITPETALQLELVLGLPASFWNTRESKYREFLARRAEGARLAKLEEWVKRFPFREMVRRGWLEDARRVPDRAHALLEFFGVASPEQWDAVHRRHAVAFRKSAAFEADPTALAAWLRMGVRRGERTHCERYARERFRECLGRARSLTRQPPEVFQDELRRLCAEAGVAVVFVPQLKGCRAHGATRWLTPHKALIQLSIRYKTEDHLWFTFFHEAAHILLHRKKAIFLEGAKQVGDEEDEANRFAADFLIPPDRFEQIAAWETPSQAAIEDFAASVGVSPGIVVGRLQHDGHLPHSHCNDLKLRLEWAPLGPAVA